MTLADRRSIIAIDPTTRGLAFVFFENGVVMDWGERLVRGESDALGVVDQLLDGCAASVLVLEGADADGCRRRERIRSLLRAMVRHARRRGTRVVEVARQDVRSAWSARGLTRKEAIAAEIASAFGELAAVVPPRRKTGATEDPRANIFDAASLAIYACDPSRVAP
jgi:hypothetical protein